MAGNDGRGAKPRTLYMMCNIMTDAAAFLSYTRDGRVSGSAFCWGSERQFILIIRGFCVSHYYLDFFYKIYAFFSFSAPKVEL